MRQPADSKQKVQGNAAPEKHAERSSAPKKQSTSRSGAPAPGFIRPELPPHLLTELRLACALLLQETGPSDEEYAVHESQPDPLETYRKDVKDIRDIREQASASQTSLQLFPSSRPHKHREHRDSKALKDAPGAANKQSRPLPRDGNTSRHTSTKTQYPQRKDSHYHPLAPVNHSHTHQQFARKPVSGDIAKAPASTQTSPRPNVRATAYSTLPAQSATSSRHTSHTTAATDAPRASTGVSSYTQASEHGRQGQKGGNVHADTSSRTWSMQSHPGRNLHSDNPDYTVIPTLHPTFHRPQSRQSAQESSRPQSRSGSIMDSIRHGIRDYVKPRPSTASTRIQSRTDSRAESRSDSRASSRPRSRGSSFTSGKSWLRSASNGLRRKGSWNSFRSSKGDEEDESPRGRRDTRPDLNRSLPPLPGLDQYKEPKVHIASLMAMGPAPAKAIPSTTAQIKPQSPHKSSSKPKHTPLTSLSQFPQPPVQPTSPLTSPLSSRSNASTRSKPRIPFSDDEDDEDSPPRHTQPSPFPKESRGWLDMEVQRRINAKLSPALSSGDDPMGGRGHSPGQSQAKAEEAIRNIARRPLPGERGESFRSQGSEGRSLSALGFRERGEGGEISLDGNRSAVGRGGSAMGYREEREERERRGVRRTESALKEEVRRSRVEKERGREEGDGVGIEIGPRSLTEGSAAGSAVEKKGLRNRLSRFLGGHGGQVRAVVAN
ncbi:MAG: serine arginine-rich splicing factor [Stictis urceolatum]|nr:serine arginine-rich splicing factor [Stictis urceolata]